MALRIAVAGVGLMGRKHIETIAHSDECAVSALIDPAPAAAAFCQEMKLPHYRTLEELFDADLPDGVILATPNTLHVDHALACVAAKVPTLIEKPVAHAIEPGRRLSLASKAAGVPVLVGHHRRHSSLMERAAQIIADGTLGKIVAVVGTALFYKPDQGYFDGHFSWRKEPGGGPILINMIHEVDNLRMLCGEIVSVQSFASNATRGFEVEDTAAVALRFASGALGTFMLSDSAASSRSWEHTSGEDPHYAQAHSKQDDCYVVTGTLGTLSIPTMRLQRYPGAEVRSWRQPMVTSILEMETVNPLERQLSHFCRVILGQETPRVSIDQGLRNVRIVAAIAESARTGRRVDTP